MERWKVGVSVPTHGSGGHFIPTVVQGNTKVVSLDYEFAMLRWVGQREAEARASWLSLARTAPTPCNYTQTKLPVLHTSRLGLNFIVLPIPGPVKCIVGLGISC